MERGARPLVAGKFRAAIEPHGPDSVAFYVSGQMLTEDYYVANKLMKGFIGSANIDTNSRLCMSSSVAGHKRAFGADVVPGVYEDLEKADLVVLVGSNLAWCHPVLFQRLERAKAARPTCASSSSIRAARRRASSPTCICRSRPAATSRCFSACCAIWRAPERCDAALCRRATPAGLMRRSPPPRTGRYAGRRDDRARRRRARDVLRVRRRPKARVTVYSQGVNQSVSGHRQGQRDPQLPSLSPAASAGRAPGPSPSPASPMPWADARSAASPISSLLTWSLTTRAHRAIVQPLLARAEHRADARD